MPVYLQGFVCSGFARLPMSHAAAAAAAPLRHSPWPLFSTLFSSRSRQRLLFSSSSSARALRPLGPQAPSSDEGGEPDAPRGGKKSRNELKRDARRAVRWGMDLAKFSTPQIKRILRIASLEREIFDALMLVKRLGPEVREGRRRQFNYIGRLLREAEPALMDDLIQAYKDGDSGRLVALAGAEAISNESVEHEEDMYEEDVDHTWASEEEYETYSEVAARWFDGLVDKEPSITQEVYSINAVEFDRQELRKLVRRVQSSKKVPDAKFTSAKKHLIHFLRLLVKKTSAE